MPSGDVVQIGPFRGGLNTYSDPTAVLDTELVMAENLELDLDGSLVQRPPFTNAAAFPLTQTGNMTLLGYYYAPDGTPYLIANDGNTSTLYFTGNGWSIVTTSVAASAITQYNNLLYLQAPLSSSNPGGSWSPTAGFTAISAIPKGSTIIAHKSRLWAAAGQLAGSGQNGTRMYLSKIADPTTWDGTFIDIGPGDGQNIIKIMTYFDDILIFKTASTFRFAFSTDPATGTPSKLTPSIGLANADSVVISDSVVYFVYSDKVYQISNYQFSQINQKVPLRAGFTQGIYYSVSIGLFNNRLIVSYYDTLYVYSLRTQQWTTWKSAQYGPIGRVIELNMGSSTHTAIAHSSAPQPVSATAFTNQAVNPRAATLTNFGAEGSGSVSAATLVNNTPYPSVSNMVNVSASGANSMLGVTYKQTGITAGSTYCFSGTMVSDGSVPGNYYVYVLWQNSSGTSIAGITGGNVASGSGGYTRVTNDNLVAPAGATQALVSFRKTGTFASGNFVRASAIMVNNGPTSLPYFDGATARGVNYYYWSGATDSSQSVQTTARTAPTLAITDVFNATLSENMTCTMVTKNYDYQAPSMFKRIFYWGVDASYRGNLRAYARSVRVATFPTWDQLLLTTWDKMLSSNWSNIGAADSSTLLTSVNTSSISSMRTFTKLGSKSFRFRQVSFRLEFDSDGTSSTAPVRIFAIMTRVNTKQTVVDQVS